MKKIKLRKLLPLALVLALLTFGCAKEQAKTAGKVPTSNIKTTQTEANVLKGSVVGKSNKAKTISITVGKGAEAKTMMVKFDDNTTGLEFANKGEAAIINWEQRGEDKVALTIKPKLAKLPDGVSEIMVEEMAKLIAQNHDFTLVDARPKSRYDQAHLPGAINIPVPLLKEQKAAALPADKNKLLVFYCGGYT